MLLFVYDIKHRYDKQVSYSYVFESMLVTSDLMTSLLSPFICYFAVSDDFLSRSDLCLLLCLPIRPSVRWNSKLIKRRRSLLWVLVLLQGCCERRPRHEDRRQLLDALRPGGQAGRRGWRLQSCSWRRLPTICLFEIEMTIALKYHLKYNSNEKRKHLPRK